MISNEGIALDFFDFGMEFIELRHGGLMDG